MSSIIADLTTRREFYSLNSGEFETFTEYVLRGNGLFTLGLGIRVWGLLAFIGIVILIPKLTVRKNLLKARMYAQISLFCIFVYVLAIQGIFGVINWGDFVWTSAAFAAAVFAIGYLRSALELSRRGD